MQKVIKAVVDFLVKYLDGYHLTKDRVKREKVAKQPEVTEQMIAEDRDRVMNEAAQAMDEAMRQAHSQDQAKKMSA